MVGHSQVFDVQLDPFDQKGEQSVKLRFALYSSVKNGLELLNFIKDGVIDCSLIRPEMILEPFQVLAAANRALHSQVNNKMICRNVHAELIYSLSPTKTITDSMKTFAYASGGSDVLVVTVDDDRGAKLKAVHKKIKGKSVALSQLKEMSNYDEIKKAYHVREPDLNKFTIMDAILSRIVAKDIISTT